MHISNGERSLIFNSFNTAVIAVIFRLFSDRLQPSLEILTLYVKLAGDVLGPEYISIYVKYCYLDTLLLFIEIFLELTPGKMKMILFRFDSVII